MSILPDLDRQLAEIRADIAAASHHFNKRLDTIMTKMDDEAARAAANTVKINAMATAITSMSEGHSTISDEIKALKDAVAAGTPPDFTALDAAMDAQDAATTAAAALVPTP